MSRHQGAHGAALSSAGVIAAQVGTGASERCRSAVAQAAVTQAVTQAVVTPGEHGAPGARSRVLQGAPLPGPCCLQAEQSAWRTRRVVARTTQTFTPTAFVAPTPVSLCFIQHFPACAVGCKYQHANELLL